MTRKPGRLAVAVALLFALARPGAAEEASGPASGYVGVWVLDLDASDSIEPLMKLMDAPWIARKLAGSMTPTLTFTPNGDGGLRLLNENPIRTTDQQMPIDGVERERENALGRKVVSSESWNHTGQLVVTQKTHVDEHRVVVVTSTWIRKGDHLELTNTAETEDGPLVIRRIFRAKR